MHCEDALPFVVRLFGVPPTARLLQSPAFPLGEADGSALLVLGRWDGIVPGCPGEKILISGHVQSGLLELLVGLPIPPAIFGDANDPVLGEQQSAALPVKLRIYRCQFPGPVMIDSDRSIVFDAGERVRIDVVAPPTWSRNTGGIFAGESVVAQFATVTITACPLRCCWPPSARLTYFAALANGDAIVRPRRAVRFQTSAVPAGPHEWLMYNGDPGSGASVGFGAHVVNGGFVSGQIEVGAASHLQLIGGGPAMIGMVWEIA